MNCVRRGEFVRNWAWHSKRGFMFDGDHMIVHVVRVLLNLVCHCSRQLQEAVIYKKCVKSWQMEEWRTMRPWLSVLLVISTDPTVVVNKSAPYKTSSWVLLADLYGSIPWLDASFCPVARTHSIRSLIELPWGSSHMCLIEPPPGLLSTAKIWHVEVVPSDVYTTGQILWVLGICTF